MHTDTAPHTDTQALRLLDQYIVSDVECNGHHMIRGEFGPRWYDVRPMLDEREHCPEFIDMARAAIELGVSRGVLKRHPEQPHIVKCAELTWP